MKRLLCAYRNASLRVKLSLLVTAVLLTVLIACQVALYFYVAENVERQARSAADVTLTQAQTYMDAKLRNVVERLFYIRLDPSFEGALTDYLLSDKPSAQGVAMTLLSPCLSLHKVTEPLISSIFLYTPKSSFTDMGVSTEQEYRFEASVLWRQAEESESYVIWGEVQKDEIFITHREVLPVMYRFSVDGYGGDCVLLANIDKARLTAYLHDIVPDDGSDMLLVDGRGRLVTQAGGAAAAALAEDEDCEGAAMICLPEVPFDPEHFIARNRSARGEVSDGSPCVGKRSLARGLSSIGKTYSGPAAEHPQCVFCRQSCCGAGASRGADPYRPQRNTAAFASVAAYAQCGREKRLAGL